MAGQPRESLSSFFAWCVSEGYVAINPVKGAAAPKDRRTREDMRPVPAHEFEAVVQDVAQVSGVYADLVHVLGRTGIRWGGDHRSQDPEVGQGPEVPLPDALLPAIRRFAEGESPDDCSPGRAVGGSTVRPLSGRPAGAKSGEAARCITCDTLPPAGGFPRASH